MEQQELIWQNGEFVAWEDAPHAWPSMTGKTVFTRS